MDGTVRSFGLSVWELALVSCRSVRRALGLLIVLTGGVSPSLAQFEIRGSTSISTAPFAFAVGDFNRDGKLDLAVTSYIPNNGVTILLGNGDGTFRIGTTYSFGVQLFYIAAADLRSNGITDLIVSDDGSNDVYVMLGNGDGTFETAVPHATVGTSVSVSTGDFNGDGKPDIVAVTRSSQCTSCISVLLGNGDGTFQPEITTMVPYGISGVALAPGYFNADSKLDLAVVGFFGTLNQVDILLGNGDGTFTPNGFCTVSSAPESVTVADFNGDKKSDLAVGELDGSAIGVLLGNGDGTFQSAVNYSTNGPTWVAAADLDGSGIPDLVASNGIDPGGVSVLKGNGDGTFQAGVFYPGGTEGEFVAIGDFNGDGKPDLVSADYVDEEVVTFLNTGVVSFSPTTPISLPTTLLGNTSPSRSATLTNNGTSPLMISSIKSSGSPFHMNTTCQGSVAPGGSCSITATFTAQVEGVTTGTVTIHDSASSRPQVVEILGTGTGVKLAPSKLTFPAQKVGTQSLPQTIQLTNIGSAPLNFTRTIYVGGRNYTDFLESDTCGTQIGAGASCTISITFKPRRTGTFTANVTVSDDGGGSPQTAALSGTGD